MNRLRATYEQIGVDYNRHRVAEPSVVRELVRLLGLSVGSCVADIGAGTGNYTNALAQCGFGIKAIEPSSVMRDQSLPNENIEWYAGTAEAIPLPDDSVQGVVSTLALHHFLSLEKAAIEMQRVCPNGPLVALTIDPRLGEDFWLSEYFPAIHKRLFSTFPPIDTVCNALCQSNRWRVDVTSYLLPHDAVDMTMHSGWNRPEIYLDRSHRQNMSGFALASSQEVEPGLVALQAALASGEWESRHGHLRKKLSADLGFRFIKLTSRAA